MPSRDPRPRKGATTAQLRAAIDSGRTGDKIAAFDPAAAPLGTDEEAAGTPPSPDLVQQALAQEVRDAQYGEGAQADGARATGLSNTWLAVALALFVIAMFVVLLAR